MVDERSGKGTRKRLDSEGEGMKCDKCGEKIGFLWSLVFGGEECSPCRNKRLELEEEKEIERKRIDEERKKYVKDAVVKEIVKLKGNMQQKNLEF